MAHVANRSRRKGLAVVETALVFPLILLLTLGVIEYGWLFLKVHQTTNAARNGARLAVTADATQAEVLAEIAGLMNEAGMSDGGYAVTITPSDFPSMSPGHTLTVEVVVPCAGNLDLVGLPFIPVPNNIRASVSMAKEGP